MSEISDRPNEESGVSHLWRGRMRTRREARLLRSAFTALLAPALFVTAVARADTLAPTDDATVGGHKNQISASFVSAGRAAYGLVRFDLSPLPAGVPLAKATLRLFVNSVNSAGTLSGRAVASAWDEATVSSSSAPALGGTVAS